MKITGLEHVKKKIKLSIDGYYYSMLSSEHIEDNKLSEGMEIDKTSLNKIVLKSEKNEAQEKLFNYISRSMKTNAECVRYLKEKGYNKVVIDAVMEVAVQYGYINDKKYVELYIEYNKSNKGSLRLKNELKLKGIDLKLINDAMDTQCLSEPHNAYAIALKYLKNKELDKKTTEKLIRHLYARGYTYDIISETLNRLKINKDEDYE